MPDPTQPSTPKRKPRTKPEKKAPIGRPPKHDWNAIRREFIRGDDTVTLEALSHKTGYPSKGMLKNRSAAEDWADLRADFRAQVMAKFQQIDLDLKTEVKRRQARVGKDFVALAVRGMSHLKPETLDPIDVARFAKIGAELERKALGMEEINVKFGRIRSPDDLDKLTEEELWQVAAMLPPEEGADDDF